MEETQVLLLTVARRAEPTHCDTDIKNEPDIISIEIVSMWGCFMCKIIPHHHQQQLLQHDGMPLLMSAAQRAARRKSLYDPSLKFNSASRAPHGCEHNKRVRTQVRFLSIFKSSSLTPLLMLCQTKFLLTRTAWWEEIDLLGRGVSEQLCLENVAPVH